MRQQVLPDWDLQWTPQPQAPRVQGVREAREGDVMSPEVRELENALLYVADTAAEFVDGDATIEELREAVANWRKASQVLAEVVRREVP